MSVGDLAKTLTPTSPFPGLALRQAVVTAVAADGATISVRVGASTVAIGGVKRLASLSLPRVGDAVWVLQNGPDLLALGRVAAANSGALGDVVYVDQPSYAENRLIVKSGIELYHPAPTPFIDFHRAADPAGDADADYNVRLINNASGYLELLGGRLRVGWAEMGTHPVHGAYAWFGRTSHAATANYAFLTNGDESIINSSINTYISQNGAWRFRVDATGNYFNGPIGMARGTRLHFSGWDYNLSISDPGAGAGVGGVWGSDGLYYRGWNTHTFFQSQHGVYGMQIIGAGEMWVRLAILAEDEACLRRWQGSSGHALAGHKNSTHYGYMTRNDGWLWLMGERVNFRMAGADVMSVHNSGGWAAVHANLPWLAGATMVMPDSTQMGRAGSRADIKTDIRAEKRGATNPLWSFQTKRFKWDEDKVQNGRDVNARNPEGVFGMIAEEVYALAPDAVHPDPWDGHPTGFDQNVLNAYMVDALLFLRGKLDEAEGLAADAETRLAAIERLPVVALNKPRGAPTP